MIICLIGIGIIAIFWLMFLYNYICDKLMCKYDNLSSEYWGKDEEKSKLYYKKYKFWSNAEFWDSESNKNVATFISVILSFLYGVVFLGMKGDANCQYKDAINTKTQIEYVLENNIVANEDESALIVKAIEVNNKIRYYKRFQNNIWVNWFGNADFANMEEIDLDSFT